MLDQLIVLGYYVADPDVAFYQEAVVVESGFGDFVAVGQES